MAEFKLGRILHDMNASARVHARHVTLPMENAARADYTHALMERMERELAPSIQKFYAQTLADPDAPENVRAAIHATAYPENQFDAILGLASAVIGIFSIAGAISSVEVEAYIHQLQAKLTPTPLSPQEMALAVVKGERSGDEGAAQAALSGIDAHRFDLLTRITGEPPAIQELLFLWRRGKIDTDRLVHGVRQSRVRDEWVDAIEALAFAPPSAQEAVAAAVQGHLSPDEARAVVAENGIDPGAFDWLYETAGRPPGIELLLTLMHRGLMSRGDVEAAIRESDIKNKYIPAIIQAGDYIPPVRSVVAMLRASAITPDRARALLTENGVRADDIDGYIGEATKGATQTHRDLTASNLVTAYRDGLTGRADVRGKLVALGYDDTEAGLLLDIADSEQPVQLQRQVIATTRAKYVAHRIDAPTASGVLDSAHVDAAQRDRLLAAWELERGENVKQLTPAVLTKGVKNNAVTWEAFLAYMSALGYSDDDALLYGQIEGIAPAAGA